MNEFTPAMVGKLVQITITDTTQDNALVGKIVGVLAFYSEDFDDGKVGVGLKGAEPFAVEAWHAVNVEVVYL